MLVSQKLKTQSNEKPNAIKVDLLAAEFRSWGQVAASLLSITTVCSAIMSVLTHL